VGIILFGFGLLVGAMTVRLLHLSRVHLEAGLAAVAAAEVDMARVELEDSAKAYVPGSPYSRRALEELAILAKTEQMRGDTEQSLHTWEVLRRSVLATRHFAIPNRKFLERAEFEILGLRKAEGMDDVLAKGAVARPDDPSPVLSLLLVLSFGAWLVGSAFVAAGVGQKDGLVPTRLPLLRGLPWPLCLGGLILWIVLSALV
jgi:hypothetical protein